MISGEAHQRRTVLVSALLLSLAALIAYANSFSVPFLFDDWVTIQHNPRLRELWPIWSAFNPPEFTGVGGRPVANLSLVLNYAISGDSVPGFHAINLLIHLLAGLTLFGIVRRTLRLPRWQERYQRSAETIALAAAALWLLQPLHTQAVTYVSQRTESLMGLFYLLTLYAFIRGVIAASRGWLLVAVVSCFAGMATKEGMVTVPVVVLLYDFVFLSGSVVTAWRRRWLVYAGLASSWILLAVLMSGLRGRGVGFGLGMSGWSYLLIECRAIMHYLSLSLWPAPLVFDYGVDLGRPGWTEALSAVALAGFGVGTIAALWRRPAAGFLAAWFLITLAPTSSVVPIPLQPVSENRVYVPSAAVLTALAFSVHACSGPRGLRACFVAALAFAGLTALRNRDYASEIAIWSDTVAKRPDSSRAHSNLGHALQAAGRLAEAKAQHERALQLRPEYAEAHVNLAALLGQLGQIDQAVAHSRRATEIDPRNPNAFFNLGVGLTQKGDLPGAIAAYEAALRLRTASAETHSNLALLLLRVGRPAEAILQSEAALRLKPGLVIARFALAVALTVTGKPADAIPHFQEVVRTEPNHFEASLNLGNLLLQLGRAPEALGPLATAARLNPNQPEIHFALGNALQAAGRVPEAIRSYEAAVRLNPQFEAAKDMLARLRSPAK